MAASAAWIGRQPLHVLGRGGRRLHVGDEVGGVRVADLRQVHLVPRPLGLALEAEAGFDVARRVDHLRRRRDVGGRPPARRVRRLRRVRRSGGLGRVVLLDPDPAQRLHRGHGAQPVRGIGGGDGPQQAVAVRADGDRQRRPRRLVFGEPGRVEPGAVALGPVVPHRRQVGPQPVRRRRGQRVERVAQRLAHALEAVEHAERRQHVGGVRALAPARPQQAGGPAAREQRIEQRERRVTRRQPGAELAQHRGVEAGVGQLQPQEVLPVDPAPHRVGRRRGRRGPRRTAGPARARARQGASAGRPRTANRGAKASSA